MYKEEEIRKRRRIIIIRAGINRGWVDSSISWSYFASSLWLSSLLTHLVFSCTFFLMHQIPRVFWLLPFLIFPSLKARWKKLFFSSSYFLASSSYPPKTKWGFKGWRGRGRRRDEAGSQKSSNFLHVATNYPHLLLPYQVCYSCWSSSSSSSQFVVCRVQICWLTRVLWLL